jgi:hypothetical protein
MKKTRKPEVKLEVDRAGDRSLGVAGLMESARIFVEPGRDSGCLGQQTDLSIMSLAIRLHKVSAIFFIYVL